jgi:hypothetical protein
MSVNIYQRDLLTPDQLAAGDGDIYPNADANVASVKIPLKVWIGGPLSGKELVILSKKA